MVDDKTPETPADWTPRPDPTVLTTAAILRELQGLQALLATRIDCAKELSDTRFAGMDKAITLLQVITDRQPQDVDRKITSLQKLHEEKFASVEKQFEERDVRVEQTAKDTKTAVDAALAAQVNSADKQAESFGLSIGKSEAGTTKQIDQMGTLIQSNTKATDDKIADLKERLTRLEGTAAGVAGNRTEERHERVEAAHQQSDFSAWIFGVVGVVIGLAGVIAALVVGLHR